MRKKFVNGIYRAIPMAALLVAIAAAQGQQMPSEYDQALKTLGKQGDFKSNVLKINIPRNDLKVIVDGVATPTPFGFGGWLAMTKGAHGDVMMGDLVLTQDEVNPVMSALLDHGLEVTAVHNHFFFEEPRIFYMHVMGHGTPAELAKMAKPAIDLIGNVPASHTATTAAASSGVQAGSMDTAKLAQIAGHDGEQTGQVYKITVGRDDLQIKEMGAPINARMGLNTWAAFFGSDQQAVIAGDVAMVESEVQPVLKALRSHGLSVVAIHQHMTDTRPMIFFLHYWGKGSASDLATGFRAALDQLGKNKPPVNSTARR
jgi:uncharacterized protein DUF1259